MKDVHNTDIVLSSFFQAMSRFPPSKWRVRYLKDMKSLACEAAEEDGVSMAAYMAVKPSEGEEGTFRFALHGPDAIKLKFAVNKVLPSGLFNNMFVEAEMVVGDHIKLDNNTVCSDWLDVVELVKAQDVLVVNDNDDDVGAEFLMAMESNKKDLIETTGKADNVGICLRWSLGTMGADTRIRLIAQVSLHI